MPVDFSSLTIIRCSPEQTRQSHINTFPFWGEPRGFNLDWYFEREEALASHPWAEGDRFVTWALVSRANPTSLDLLAHCETYRRNSIMLPPDDKTPTETISYGIASVYCPPKYRGNKYPQLLLGLLHYVLASPEHLPPFPSAWGAPPSVDGFRDSRFSVLYSDVGDKYYENCRKGSGESSEPGWVRVKMSMRIWTIDSEASSTEDDGWQWLDEHDVQQLEEGVAMKMHRDLVKTGTKTKTRLAILPEEHLLKIHVIRDKMSVGTRTLKPKRAYGLSIPPPEGVTERPFITYSFPSVPGTAERLIITHVQHPFPFSAVVAAAKREKCKTVELWGDWAGWDTEAGGPEFETESSLPCLAQYGLGGDDAVEWVWCEKYAWC